MFHDTLFLFFTSVIRLLCRFFYFEYIISIICLPISFDSEISSFCRSSAVICDCSVGICGQDRTRRGVRVPVSDWPTPCFLTNSAPRVRPLMTYQRTPLSVVPLQANTAQLIGTDNEVVSTAVRLHAVFN